MNLYYARYSLTQDATALLPIQCKKVQSFNSRFLLFSNENSYIHRRLVRLEKSNQHYLCM